MFCAEAALSVSVGYCRSCLAKFAVLPVLKYPARQVAEDLQTGSTLYMRSHSWFGWSQDKTAAGGFLAHTHFQSRKFTNIHEAAGQYASGNKKAP